MSKSNDDLLHLLGATLRLDDKISLVFLLSDDPKSSLYVIQQLKECSSLEEENGLLKQFLLDFSLYHPFAPNALTEAAGLLQNHRTLRLLGKENDRMAGCYLNEVRKHLYKLAETLTEEQTCEVVRKVTGTSVNECRYLEELILDWQIKGILTVGPDLDSSLESINRFFNVSFTTNPNPDFHRLSNDSSDEYYPIFDSNEVGFCVIINNSNFTQNKELPHLMPKELLPPRPGSEQDMQLVCDVFSSFKFKTFPYENVTYTELKKILDEYSSTVQKSHSFFTMVVMSHGTEDVVYTADSVPVRVEALEMSFQRNKCPQLAGKPKILIIQACQGEEIQRVQVDGLDNKVKSLVDNTTMGPERGDALIAWSTVKGYASFRDRIEGSWFIQELCNELKEDAAKKDLVDIVTKVNFTLRHKTCHGACMVPSLTSSLCKKIKFL